MKKRHVVVCLVLVLFLSVSAAFSVDDPLKALVSPSQPQVTASSLNSLPILFIENKGQVDGRVKFVTKRPFGNIYFGPDEIVYQFINPQGNNEKIAGLNPGKPGRKNQEIRFENIRLKFIGASEKAQPEAWEENAAKFSYFRGNDPQKWVSGAGSYEKILYRDLYPGIDLLIQGKEGKLKHEYLVKPGAGVEDIRMCYAPIKHLGIDDQGRLNIDTGSNQIIEDAPIAYQIVNGEKRAVKINYAIDETGTLGFRSEPYEKAADLIIDPQLVFSTYVGGSNQEQDGAITVDAAGNVYISGYTWSSDFPTTGGAFDTTFSPGYSDSFVTKVNAAGSGLVFSTYLGGNGDDTPRGIAVGANGEVYVCGYTLSSNFPTTPSAYDTVLGGTEDVFLTKLNAGGTDLVYSTLLGGSVTEEAYELVINKAGNAFVTGVTFSSDFPTTPGAFDTTYSTGDVFVTKFNTSGTGLVFSTFFGGSATDQAYGIVLDHAENVFIMGRTSSSNLPTSPGAYDTSLGGSQDLFVAKFNSDATALSYSTYLGGSGNDVTLGGLAVDGGGNAYVVGFTDSSNFPLTPGAFDSTLAGSNDGSVTKINPSGTALVYSTYLGGSGYEYCRGIGVDAFGNAIVVGYSQSTDWPTTADAYDKTANGDQDIVLTQINATGTGIFYSTYFGGSGGDYVDNGLALDIYGNAYIGGNTSSSNFPTSVGAYDRALSGYNDDVIVKFTFPAQLMVFDGNDFNGNGYTDITVFRPSNGMWYIKDVTTVQWGAPSDIPVNGNYDGDTDTDAAIWRPSSGLWYISGGATVPWGTVGDIPVPHDYNGGGTTDIAVWRPSNGVWYVNGLSDIQWGQAGDYPVPGDYDGDGVDEVAVWRPSEGAWYINGVGYFQWGTAGDIPLPADYNGDSITDIAVWRPSNGQWFVQLTGGGTITASWGIPGDVPVPGDYDNDAAVEIAVWRPSSGLWFVYLGSTSVWGMTGDIPVVR